MKKLEISRKDLDIVKGFFQIQILLETLDEIQSSTMFHLKGQTKNYLNSLKVQAEPILETMYSSNPNLFETITKELRSSVDNVEKYFKLKN